MAPANENFKITGPAVGWSVYDMEPHHIPHVVPDDDLMEHDLGHAYDPETKTLDIGCWCFPCLVDNMIIHHSADHREDNEPGRHTCNPVPIEEGVEG